MVWLTLAPPPAKVAALLNTAADIEQESQLIHKHFSYFCHFLFEFVVKYFKHSLSDSQYI